MNVLRIRIEDTYPLRHKMLRPNGTIQDCHFKYDNDEQTFHLGAFENNKLGSVASFYFENHELFTEHFPYQYRLRGMCTLPEFQNQGMSSALLKTAFPLIKQNQCNLLWCNARKSAQGFYEKVGFKASGDYFEIKDIGTHT